MFKIYRFLNLLSLDVACGAVICAKFFADITNIKLLPQELLVLGLSVWIIYSIDHLLDARKITKRASTARHLFHQKNFRLLSLIVLLTIILDLFMVIYIRKQILISGLGLSFAVLLYLLIQRWINPLKEMTAALLYSAGIFLPVLSFYREPILPQLLTLMFLFYLTALINMILFSLFDIENDRRDNQRSFSTFFGDWISKRVLLSLFILQIILLTTVFLQAYRLEVLILGLMNIVLLLLFTLNKKHWKRDRFHMAGDVIFIFPLIYLLF